MAESSQILGYLADTNDDICVPIFCSFSGLLDKWKWKLLFLDDIGGGAFLPTSTQTNLTKFINGLFIYLCFFEHNKLFYFR